MRTVKRLSVKLNQNKYERLTRIAEAFAQDKQVHLDHYQAGTMFVTSKSWRARRNALKLTAHHQVTPLSVHASDLAVKEAYETETKYWAVLTTELRERIGSRNWTKEQKHYAFWLLCAERRFADLILSQAPLNDQIVLTLAERKQVQNYLRRQARKLQGQRPTVKIARSFVLDNSLYGVSCTLTGQVLLISSLEKGERVALPLLGEGEISGNLRIVLQPETRTVEVHVTFSPTVSVPLTDTVTALDVNLTDVFTDDGGQVYGREFKEFAKNEAAALNKKGKRRNKLHALAHKYQAQGKKKKARNIRKYNLGRKKQKSVKRRAQITTENIINRAVNEMLALRQPHILVVEQLDFRGPAQSKNMSRRVSNWRRQTLNKRIEFKASLAGCERKQVNPAYTSQTCPKCGYLDKKNRTGDLFQCRSCTHAGQAGEIAAQNQQQRYFDSRITLFTPKETVKTLLLADYHDRLEHSNASNEKIRRVTVPGQTSERRTTRFPRQSKSETVTGKSTKSVTKGIGQI